MAENVESVQRPTVVGATLTRHSNTTTYAIGDLIAKTAAGAADTTPNSISVARGVDLPGMIRKLRLKVNDTAWKNATVRVHLFKNAPTTTCGDNDALNASETYAMTESLYLGSTDIVLAKQFSDGYVKGFGVPDYGSEWTFDPASQTDKIYYLLETRTAVAPAASKVFSLTAETIQG